MAGENKEEKEKMVWEERRKRKERERDNFVCLFGFYGISAFVGYLMPNPFLNKNSSISSNSV